jgi:ABC-type lipoprotein export system ATPase subunit
MSLIRLDNINRYYGTKDKKTVVLKDLDLQIEQNDMMAVRGKSGSGKTTLLNILGGIDFPDSGEYFFLDKPIKLRNQNDAAKFRHKHIGVIVQHFALLDDLSAFDNIAMALWADRISAKELRRRVETLMDELEILPLKKQSPLELSLTRQRNNRFLLFLSVFTMREILLLLLHMMIRLPLPVPVKSIYGTDGLYKCQFIKGYGCIQTDTSVQVNYRGVNTLLTFFITAAIIVANRFCEYNDNVLTEKSS